MALHDVITICAAREDERNINGTFLLKEKSWMMLTALCLRVARENRNEQGFICLPAAQAAGLSSCSLSDSESQS